MQVMVTVIITTVLQTQPGLQASLPACSVTGPGSMQSIYSNFTMKVQSVLWPAHTPQGGRCRGKLFRSKHECWVGLGITSWLDSWSSCFPLCSDRVRYPPHQRVFLAGAECQQHSAGEPWRSSTPVLGTLRALSRVTQRWHSGDTAVTRHTLTGLIPSIPSCAQREQPPGGAGAARCAGLEQEMRSDRASFSPSTSQTGFVSQPAFSEGSPSQSRCPGARVQTRPRAGFVTRGDDRAQPLQSQRCGMNQSHLNEGVSAFSFL